MKPYYVVYFIFLTISLFSNFLYAQWIQTDGPGAGKVSAVAVHGATMIAGVDEKGIFYSDTTDNKWYLSGEDFTTSFFKDLLMNDSIALCGTGTGIFISYDNGENWSSSNTGFTGTVAYEFLALGEKIFVASDSGIFVSTDNGLSWSAKNSGIEDNYKRTYCLTAIDSTIYAGTDYGIVFSKDSGQSWMYDNAGISLITPVHSIMSAGDTLFAGTTLAAIVSIYRKIGSSTWMGSDFGIPDTQVDDMIVYGSHYLALTWAGEIFQSSNGGSSWTPANTGLPTSKGAHRFSLSNNILYCGTLNGVYKTINDSFNWIDINDGLTASKIPHLLATDSKVFASIQTGSAFKGVHETINGGDTWTPCSLYADAYLMITKDADKIYVSGSDGLFKTIDWGESWSYLSNYGAASMAFSGDTIYMGTTYIGVLVSTDNGNSWTNMSNGLPKIATSYLPIFALIRTPSSIIAGTQAGVYFSIDEGQNWNGGTGVVITGLVADGNIVFASEWNSNTIYRFSDGGISWTYSSIESATSVKCLLKIGNSIIAGTDNGIYISDDSGATWNDINAGFPSALSIYSLSANSTHLFAGTYNSAVWKRPLSEILTGISEIAAQSNYINIYPNPAHNELTICINSSFQNFQPTTFRICDLSGQLIKEIPIPENQKEMKVSVVNMSDGLYLCETLNERKKLAVNKILILR